MSTNTKVSRIAAWSGWCTPCESEDRPLVLTRTGPAGARAWLSGFAADDGFLLLTCNLCGHWQLVPAREEDDPEVLLVEDEVHEAVAAVLAEARTAPAEVVAAVPTPRAPAPAELVADVTQVPARAAAVVDLTAADPLVEVPPVCVVPSPRSAALRDAPPAPAPEAVAAAARVLAAARAQTSRTAPRAAARPAPLDRSRRTRSTASGRRTSRPAAARAPRPAVAAVATSIALPTTSAGQVVLAAAS